MKNSRTSVTFYSALVVAVSIPLVIVTGITARDCMWRDALQDDTARLPRSGGSDAEAMRVQSASLLSTATSGMQRLRRPTIESEGRLDDACETAFRRFAVSNRYAELTGASTLATKSAELDAMTLAREDAADLLQRSRAELKSIDSLEAGLTDAGLASSASAYRARLKEWISVLEQYPRNLDVLATASRHCDQEAYKEALVTLKRWRGEFPSVAVTVRDRAKLMDRASNCETVVRRFSDRQLAPVGRERTELGNRIEQLAESSSDVQLTRSERQRVISLAEVVPRLRAEAELRQISLRRPEFWLAVEQFLSVVTSFTGSQGGDEVREYARELLLESVSRRLKAVDLERFGDREDVMYTKAGAPDTRIVVTGYFDYGQGMYFGYDRPAASPNRRRLPGGPIEDTRIINGWPRKTLPAVLAAKYNSRIAELEADPSDPNMWTRLYSDLRRWEAQLREHGKQGGDTFGMSFRASESFVSGVLERGNAGNRWMLLRTLVE